ncbi:hypothetical protein pEaSNUABM11_00274 [Erwinia phage pEa_SNUABM_11]|nr:hypothetical protein pEaSNUABM11_00274 [Erwinia phage pEa_SNUABM_11]
MINQYSLNAATNAMLLAKQSSLNVAADEGSPVGLLNKATPNRSVYDSTVTDEVFYQDFANATKVQKPAIGTGEEAVVVDTAADAVVLRVDDHESTLFELKTMAVQRVNGMVDFARNVVQPFVDDVIKNMQIAPVKETSEDWNLEPIELEASIDDPLVHALIKSVATPTAHSYQRPAIDLKIPEGIVPPESGSRALDDLLAKLLNEKGWNVGEALSKMVEPFNLSPAAPEAPAVAKDQVLFMLLSSFYVDNPWENSGVTSAKWENILNSIFYSTVSWTYLFAQDVVTRTEAGQLVYSYDGATKTVYVCQEAFDRYLEEGGTTEALLGAIYASDDGDPKASLLSKSIIENLAKYTQGWERRSSVNRMKEDTDWLSTNRQALKAAFNVAIGNADHETFGRNIAGDLLSVDEVRKSVSSSIDYLFNRDSTDITAFAIRTAAAEVFGEWEIAGLLQAIHEGMTEGANPSEVASDWAANYVIDWLLGGILIDMPA